MKLFSKEIDKKLFSQYSKGSDLDNQVVVTKIFNPYGKGRWFLLNSDPQNPDYVWAIVQMGDIVEMGSVLRSELESVRVTPFRFPLERDLSFRMVNAGELFRGLQEGKFYKKGGWVNGYSKGGMTAGRWYKDKNGEEFRYVGEDSMGNALFSDGEKVMTKSYDDFEEKPKENKLFGFFDEGGEVKKYAIVDENTDRIYIKSFDKEFINLKYKELKEIYPNDELSIIEFEEREAKEYVNPKYMAKGGEVVPYIMWVSKDGEKREFYADYKSQRAAEMAMNKLWEKGEYRSMGNLPKHLYEKEGLYSKGGKLIGNQKKLDVNKNGKLDAQDFKMLRGDKMAMGGETTFAEKVSKVKASLLKRKKVAPSVQKDYGKTYSPKEAKQSAQRIVGAMVSKMKEKVAKRKKK